MIYGKKEFMTILAEKWQKEIHAKRVIKNRCGEYYGETVTITDYKMWWIIWKKIKITDFLCRIIYACG